MNHRAPFVLLMSSVAAISLSACGGSSGSASSAPATVAQSASSAATNTTSSTATPTSATQSKSSATSTPASATVTHTVAPTTKAPATTKAAPAKKTAVPVKLGGYCGKVQGMSVTAGSSTSCAFAMNAARAAFANLDAGNPSAPVTAYSPAAGRNVTLQAGYGAHGWDLTGGNNAYVRIGG